MRIWLLSLIFLISLPRCGLAVDEASKSSDTILDINNFAEFLITPDELKDLLKKSKVVLVDIRPKNEFERVRIPGSLHMEIYTIKTKNFLKKKDVIIIANGYRLATPLKECKKLKNQGFKSVRVLYGGIQAWINYGGKVEGIGPQESAKCSFYNPLLLFEEKQLNDWIVLDLWGEKEKISRLFPNWQVISVNYAKNSKIDEINYINSPKNLKNFLKERISAIKQPTEPFRRYFIFCKIKLNLEKIFCKKGMLSLLFIYKGSISDYESFLKKEELILKAKRKLEKRRKRRLEKPCRCEL